MAKPGTVIGWKLPRDEREALLERFPPRYEDVDRRPCDPASRARRRDAAAARSPRPGSSAAPTTATASKAMVVELDGTTDRPDGSTYHITWSLGPGRKARESNDVLRDRGWDHLDAPIPVELEPARF